MHTWLISLSLALSLATCLPCCSSWDHLPTLLPDAPPCLAPVFQATAGVLLC